MTTTQIDRSVRPGRVSQISLPDDARALSTLSRIDYEDAFLVDGGVERTPEQWARAVFDDAPLAVRTRLVSGWTGLGLNLGGPSSIRRVLGGKVQQVSPSVLGWKVRQVNPRVMLLAADSLLGLEAELLFRSQPGGFLFSTLIQQNNAAARAVWAAMTSTHQGVVRSLLEHAVRREQTSETTVNPHRSA